MFRPLTACFALALIAVPALAPAGGELSERSSRGRARMSARTAELVSQYAELNRSLSQMEMAAALDAEAAMQARAKKVTYVKPIQDKYGDPMYTWYGPLVPEPGTPEYDGPSYGASFARNYLETVPHDQYRGYARGAQYNQARVISKIDYSLGTASSNMYMQSGMQVAPGSMSPSAARAMINNP